MYAIVEIAGQQFKVTKDQYIYVHRLEGKEGSKVTFDKVLLIDNKGKVNVGAPAINGAAVTAKVLEHVKGDKVIVFKKKRRKGYKVKNGHRQSLTKILIEKIDEKGGTAAKSASAAKTEAKPAAEKKAPAKSASAKATATEKKAAPKAEAKTAEKKAPAKSASAKAAATEKKAAPKAEAKKPAAKKAPAKSASAKATATEKKAAPKKDDKK